jgi:two-component system sensor histidine kinase AdeS
VKLRFTGLGGQIVLSMVVATIASVVLTIVGLNVFYGILVRTAPELLSTATQWFPTRLEWAVILGLCTAAGIITVIVARRLARRIVAPLVSVARAARRIADGDLLARAEAGDRSLLEAAMLVDDFNLLAERLDAASQAVTRWNAAIAHELRTPVTILSGRLQGLADGVFHPNPPLLRSLVAQVEALTRLIEDLRTVSLFDGGRLDARLQPTDLAEEIRGVVRLMSPGMEAVGFRIETQLDEGQCDVDAARVRQALMALMENAQRHARPCTVRVRLTLDRALARIDVIDDGPGLPDDFIPYAFEPFRRYMEVERPTKGSGLGLAVVLAIAQVHGGTASYATVGGGACFSMILQRNSGSTKRREKQL